MNQPLGDSSATRILPNSSQRSQPHDGSQAAVGPSGHVLRPEDIALAARQAASTGEGLPGADVAEYALRLGDDALILAQRLGHWISRGPELEEDVALGNIALDELGHARSFLSYAGSAWNKSEDELAYFRREEEFRSAHLFEQPNGDFAATIVRQFIASNYQFLLYRALMGSSDPTLAAIAAKAVKEVDYHVDHSSQWVLRLAGGTDESRRRMVAALKLMWPFAAELFEDDSLTDRLGSAGVTPSSLRAGFDLATGALLAEAELDISGIERATGGGRSGHHSEHLGFMLAEMQVLAREFPGASW
ncbi:1,2-phenylacetyl-CoA epoxidase subunit PaaC [Arthrobacter antibioticus]|uniref:1,2-phenylacetyl-CoA epoxidase subunit PaaC n=1 Tax=Arthrobacter sp. H35-MC1 TaxID=3046203 RepID=UPI0024BACF36|nr:1,2-phenylacetyl-CoA epoxidase subunit PaaC [Arthrobacter sp. H35-MC1]MDJ0316892.1 phenylacetate-CoA oxygenase subunit PaaC [Arthrobacter sp. H35-MC1]